MGQGYSLTTLSAGSAGIDVPELSDLTYEKSLGDARFMKSVRARHRNGLVVAKVVMKPYASMKFGRYIKEILHERNLLNEVPNALAYQRVFETSSNGYLVRQYMNNSIYDRMSTRPFLDDMEKRWLAFQLLSAVRDCHSRNIYHGDIKTENTLVTSWNWLYLSDFSASFKPTYLPEDNPADFSFYFDISGRRTCYLAPERFLSHGENPESKGSVNWAMDIFSVGCVIAELFLESPIFNLSQLFKYRQGEYSPEQTVLNRIEDLEIRDLVSHMIQLEPESRYSADEYLNFWRRRAFPEYFYSFLHQYMLLITNPTFGQSRYASSNANTGESDDRIDRVYFEFDKISYFLGHDDNQAPNEKSGNKRSFGQLFPLHLDVPSRINFLPTTISPSTDDGTLLFVNVVTSALRSTARSTARIRACELLLAFSECLTDEAKLDRVLPFVITLLNDSADIVKVAALRTLTQLVALVGTTSPVNAYLFPEYIIPRLEAFVPLSGRKSSPLVRATYASCMALLAETASRFLDAVQALKTEGFMNSLLPETYMDLFSDKHRNVYDLARADLVRFFESQAKTLLTDANSDVRRAFLGSVSSLCVFFGSAKANDVILSHLNTYLNDRDWRLKCSFFDTIVGVAVFVGSTNLEEFILPLMVQALTDPEDSVVEKVLRSLSTMARLGLFQRSKTWELVDLISRFMMHPNIWIREAACLFVSSSSTFLTGADCECVLKPLLSPYVRLQPKSLDEADLLDSLKKALPRAVFDMAIMWTMKAEKGVFWKQMQSRELSSMIEDRVQVAPSSDLSSHALAKLPKNEEDQQWINRLRNAGMTAGDEFKLVALREYIWRMSQRRHREGTESNFTRFHTVTSIASLGVDLETVFFDRQQPQAQTISGEDQDVSGDVKEAQTISDALLDASTTIEPPFRSRGSSYSERREGRNVDKQAPSANGVQKADKPEVVASAVSSSAVHADILGEGSFESKIVEEPGKLQPAHSLQQKSSAMDLMQPRHSGSKATAEISTSSTNAVGTNNGPYTRQSSKTTPSMNVEREKRTTPVKHDGAHSYAGRDPNVLRLLDNLYLESLPIDTFEFGPLVTPIGRRSLEKKPSEASNPPWRPSNKLVATFGEHTGPIARIAMSPDHLFFITASDDGTVRVWDSGRLEQNLTHKSRQIHRHSEGVKVTSVCFIENTHCFVSTGNDGSVHIVKVECSESSQGYAKYGKLRLLRQWQLPNPSSYAVWTEHFKTESQSILMLATNTSQIISLDLKSMKVQFVLHNPLHHGMPTCFCLDHQKNWLIVGTSNGTMSLWDLRFRIRLRSWSIQGGASITRIALHPAPFAKERDSRGAAENTKRRLVCVSGGTGAGEATIWDLETATCAGVYRPLFDATPSIGTGQVPKHKHDSTRSYSLLNLDISDTLRTGNPVPSITSDEFHSSHPDHSIKAIAVGNLDHTVKDDSRDPYMITAGPNRTVLFWDLHRIANSSVVNGLDFDTEDTSRASSTSFKRRESPSLIPIYEERLHTESHKRSGLKPLAKSNVSSPSVGNVKSHHAGDRDSAVSSEAPTAPIKTSLINQRQRRLLKSHLDSILDVAVLEYPFRMIVSVDRSGIVLVSA